MLLEIQKKINNMLYCYYNIIGVIQRDYQKENVEESMRSLYCELEKTMKEVEELIEEYELIQKDQMVEEKLEDINIEDIVAKGENYIKGGKKFIDKIMELI